MAYLYLSAKPYIQFTRNSSELMQNVRNKITIIVFFVLFHSQAFGQSIIDMIDRASNATFTAIACDKDLHPIDTARAFFISADGLAITSAALFQNADTLIFTDHQNRRLAISRVLAIHEWSNLAIIQVAGIRNRDSDYLLPERTSFSTPSEILAFTYAENVNEAFTLGEIQSVLHSGFLGRSATVTINRGNSSRAAPIINSNGHFIGIYGYLPTRSQGILISSHIIHDEQWTSINLPWDKFKRHMHKSRLTTSLMFQAIVLQEMELWLDAARTYTSSIRVMPDKAELYALRAICRYQYGNHIGGEEDCNRSVSLNPASALPHLANAINNINQKQYRSALDHLVNCVESEKPPVQAWLMLGQIQALHGQVREAYASYTLAIEQDSLFATGYYERGRLLMQHATDQERALNDFMLAARLNHQLPGVYTLIGNIRLNQMDYLEAINDFNRALRTNPEDVHALMNRGIAHYNTGLKEQACEDWDTAGRLGNTQAFRLISRHCSELRRSRNTSGR
ncbi:tetratricopeptide repeat protein [Alkalitalea saponilacus]|uniref:Tetratricopeptide repeat-containing protein n=1 Tax=Alkalitalea saponilacus TaxID=889453 RepID=A0A1T5A7Y8_9BACT|nr:tetratricopeptide repeat protein [Alkalitalea saponilacus]ASB48807.1 hypothetical protein CDL62_06520 [Alkalitalea saponilacus]SKB31104.1 Tetratricopeptide repeat-containing protein [Alkalitalea saponilacus]